MTDIIVRNPEILGGRPVFRGTHVAVEVRLESLEDGIPLDGLTAYLGEGYRRLRVKIIFN